MVVLLFSAQKKVLAIKSHANHARSAGIFKDQYAVVFEGFALSQH